MEAFTAMSLLQHGGWTHSITGFTCCRKHTCLTSKTERENTEMKREVKSKGIVTALSSQNGVAEAAVMIKRQELKESDADMKIKDKSLKCGKWGKS